MSPEDFADFTSPLPDALCLIAADGHILAANEASVRFMHTDMDTIVSATLFDLVADNEAKVKRTLRNWSRSRTMIPGPLNVRINDNEFTPCNCSGALVGLKSENSPATILVRFEHREHFSKSFSALNEKLAQLQREIVTRQQTEQALSESKAQFEAMFNSITDAVLFADVNRQLVMLNPAVRTMFGYNDQELIGNTTEMLYADKNDYIEQGRRRYRPDAVSEGGTYEARYKRKDGTVFWTETLGTQVKNEAGEILGFVALFRDITKRKQTEAELLKHREHLEELVRERTLALEHSNHELEAYSYSIAHDLRAPLRSIAGFSEILMEDAADKLDSTDLQYLQRIVNSASHMAELIDDILELSRVSRSEMQLDEVNLSETCFEISKTLHASNSERVVEWRIQPNLKVRGDPNLLYVVMSNLLSNAWKFTLQQSRAVIEFGTAHRYSEQFFYVRDNGIGFDMKYSHKLFGLFQRLHHKDDYEGTGVGLATVKRIINRHKGKIEIESALNKGTTVYFSIPK